METSIFTEAELAFFYGVLRKNQDFVELQCGCTVSRYGDTAGTLRVYRNGRLEIDCYCFGTCQEVNLSPVEFGKHAGRHDAHYNWKNQIWVFKNDGEKVELSRTCLLKYHTSMFQRPRYNVTHRDEFLCCSVCGKERRFSMKNKGECKIYHYAVLGSNWKCSDMQRKTSTCDEVEERNSGKVIRGCPRLAKCKGCEKCVCLGCDQCRFVECGCETCVMFFSN